MHFVNERWYAEDVDTPELVSIPHVLSEMFAYGLMFGWHALISLGAAQYGIFFRACDRAPSIPHGIAAGSPAFKHLRSVVERGGGNFASFLSYAQSIEQCVVAVNEYLNTVNERTVYVADAERTYDEIVRHMRMNVVL